MGTRICHADANASPLVGGGHNDWELQAYRRTLIAKVSVSNLLFGVKTLMRCSFNIIFATLCFFYYFQESVASFSGAYYKVCCIIFDESLSKLGASSKITYWSWLHPYHAIPSRFETIFVKSWLIWLINIFCCYETKNVYGMAQDDLEAADREGLQREEALSYRPSW